MVGRARKPEGMFNPGIQRVVAPRDRQDQSQIGDAAVRYRMKPRWRAHGAGPGRKECLSPKWCVRADNAPRGARSGVPELPGAGLARNACVRAAILATARRPHCLRAWFERPLSATTVYPTVRRFVLPIPQPQAEREARQPRCSMLGISLPSTSALVSAVKDVPRDESGASRGHPRSVPISPRIDRLIVHLLFAEGAFLNATSTTSSLTLQHPHPRMHPSC